MEARRRRAAARIRALERSALPPALVRVLAGALRVSVARDAALWARRN